MDVENQEELFDVFQISNHFLVNITWLLEIMKNYLIWTVTLTVEIGPYAAVQLTTGKAEGNTTPL
jgi:hypothetical protein